MTSSAAAERPHRYFRHRLTNRTLWQGPLSPWTDTRAVTYVSLWGAAGPEPGLQVWGGVKHVLEGLGFCFYYMLKTNWTQQNLGSTKNLGDTAPEWPLRVWGVVVLLGGNPATSWSRNFRDRSFQAKVSGTTRDQSGEGAGTNPATTDDVPVTKQPHAGDQIPL